ncbi:MAG: outer membrane protein assembly factor BamD [Acidobacteria bacterium]|nr:outer membrane protein assembly factor BamD [Acidobacteriota bacterium]
MQSIRSAKIFLALLFFSITSVAILAQGPAKGKFETERDKVRELEAKHNLEVARWSISKRKAYKGGLDRLQEILDTYPNFSRVDEVFYWMGEAHVKLNEPDKAQEFYHKLLKEFPDSEFAKKAKEQLEKLKPNK